MNDIELDALYWEANWTGALPETFRARIRKEIEGNQGWVIHGNYSKVRELFWSKATHFIWLDYSFSRVFWRVFKRSVLRILKDEELWAGNRESLKKTFFSKDSIILWSIKTYGLRKKQYEELIHSEVSQHLDIIRVKKPWELKELLATRGLQLNSNHRLWIFRKEEDENCYKK